MTDPLSYDPKDAYYGPLGELAQRLTPIVPINTLALYCQLLVAIGALVGRRAQTRYIADEHHANLFLVTIGKTGVGKGTAWNLVQKIATEIDSYFPRMTHSDSASAPGLIGLVRDASEAQHGKTTVRDPGVTDKRCLVTFEEMETFITAICRQGSTLAEIWRQAWDGRTLQNNARIRERATNPHISLICHVTPGSFEDALQKLGKKSLTNGFLNRFMFVPVVRERPIHRSKAEPAMGDLIDRITTALAQLGPADLSKPPRVLDWSPDACAEWDAFCQAIDDGHPFLEGIEAVNGRLKPMVMRIALLYAVLDGDHKIGLRHLRPAKTLCLWLNDETRDLFPRGQKAGKKSLLSRLAAYTPESATFSLTDLHNWLKRSDYSTDELHSAIDDLITSGVWRAVSKNANAKHRNWVFALAAEVELPEIQDPLPFLEEPPPEIEEPLPDGMVKADGIYFACGQRIKAMQDTRAYSFDGNAMNVMSGEIGYLAAVPPDTPPEQHDAAHNRLERYPKCVTAIFGGEVLFVPREAVRVYKEPVAA